jgi:hypothetical protein
VQLKCANRPDNWTGRPGFGRGSRARGTATEAGVGDGVVDGWRRWQDDSDNDECSVVRVVVHGLDQSCGAAGRRKADVSFTCENCRVGHPDRRKEGIEGIGAEPRLRPSGFLSSGWIYRAAATTRRRAPLVLSRPGTERLRADN